MYMFTSQRWNEVQNHNIRRGHNPLNAHNSNPGKTLRNRSCKHKKNSRINSGNACRNPVQNPPSSSLVSRNKKIVILSSYLYGWEMSLTSSEQHRLKTFEKRVMRKMFGPRSV